MNQGELAQALDSAGVPRADYSLPDAPLNRLGPGETLFLDREGDGWVTYFVWRGERYGFAHFESEDAACRHMLLLLTSPRPKLPQDHAVNQAELARALESAGVDRSRYAYNLADMPPHRFGGGVTLVLDREGDRWVTYFVERNEPYGFEHFDNEDAACRHVFYVLTRPQPPPGPPLTAEEIETSHRLAEQFRRDYEARLASRGLDPERGKPRED